jgi:hypothetical protein
MRVTSHIDHPETPGDAILDEIAPGAETRALGEECEGA